MPVVTAPIKSRTDNIGDDGCVIKVADFNKESMITHIKYLMNIDYILHYFKNIINSITNYSFLTSTLK